MRIPSTSDLVHSHANRAYDKMAVISENIDKLDLIYEFIFKYFEHLKGVLSLYVDKENNQDIEGYKKFLNGIETKSIKFDDNDSEIEATIGLDATNAAEPYVYLSFTRTWENPLGELETTEVGRLKLGYSQELSKSYLEGPDTVGSISNSLVTVNYLKSVLKSNTEDLTNKLTAYLPEVQGGVTDKAVTSDGIYQFVTKFVNVLHTGYEANKELINANTDEIAKLKTQLNEALEKINKLSEDITSNDSFIHAYYSEKALLFNIGSGGEYISTANVSPIEGKIYAYNHLYNSIVADGVYYGGNGVKHYTSVKLTEPFEEEPGIAYKCLVSRGIYIEQNSATYISDSYSASKSIFIKVRVKDGEEVE